MGIALHRFGKRIGRRIGRIISDGGGGEELSVISAIPTVMREQTALRNLNQFWVPVSSGGVVQFNPQVAYGVGGATNNTLATCTITEDADLWSGFQVVEAQAGAANTIAGPGTLYAAGQSFTFFALIKLLHDVSGNAQMRYTVYNANGFFMYFSTNKTRWTIGTSSGFGFDYRNLHLVGLTPDDDWHLIAMTFNAATSEGKIYMDGVPLTTQTFTGTLNKPNPEISCPNETGDYNRTAWIGFSKSVLTDTEIATASGVYFPLGIARLSVSSATSSTLTISSRIMGGDPDVAYNATLKLFSAADRTGTPVITATKVIQRGDFTITATGVTPGLKYYAEVEIQWIENDVSKTKHSQSYDDALGPITDSLMPVSTGESVPVAALVSGLSAAIGSDVVFIGDSRATSDVGTALQTFLRTATGDGTLTVRRQNIGGSAWADWVTGQAAFDTAMGYAGTYCIVMLGVNDSRISTDAGWQADVDATIAAIIAAGKKAVIWQDSNRVFSNSGMRNLDGQDAYLRALVDGVDSFYPSFAIGSKVGAAYFRDPRGYSGEQNPTHWEGTTTIDGDLPDVALGKFLAEQFINAIGF